MTEIISKFIPLLIESLKDNYKSSAIRGHQQFVQKDDNAQYHHHKIQELLNGECPIHYTVETGKKYYKVIFVDGGGCRSVHCFIDKQNGDVYKSASWKSPAKGVRYNLLNDEDREYILQHADWSGGYLYVK